MYLNVNLLLLKCIKLCFKKFRFSIKKNPQTKINKIYVFNLEISKQKISKNGNHIKPSQIDRTQGNHAAA